MNGLLRACLFSASVMLVLGSAANLPAAETLPAWASAHQRAPMTSDETKTFIARLTDFVAENHLKKSDSPQRGLIYEYFYVERKAEVDQFPQGEALDTMHDGAWFAAAMVHAFRATGDARYKEMLTTWQLPFYLKMLNHSDSLFTNKRNDARGGVTPWNREHGLQEGEKGFVPYWWDDGGSFSIDRFRDKNPLAIRPSVDYLAGKANPDFLLDGYSQGSSNHMAQDLGVMLELAWLLFKDQPDEAGKKLTSELAEACANLQACRTRHGQSAIPMCAGPAALASASAEAMKKVAAADTPARWTPSNHYVRALYDFKPGQRVTTPGFSDDQQYRYYAALARHGRLPAAAAFRTLYDAFTEPMLFRYYWDDASPPAGVNRFDLHPQYAVDGRLEDYRSDRKGPFKKPRPIGSRMGPQNMICCGWALEVLRAFPSIWEKRYQREFSQDLRIYIDDAVAGASAEAAPRAAWQAGDTKLEIVGDRLALRISGQSKQKKITIKIFSRPDAAGSSAVISIEAGQAIGAANNRGETLLVEGKSEAVADELRFDLRVPYSVAKGQKPWANGIEHGRYSIQLGDERRNLYLASSEAQVRQWLEHELAGGLRTWQAIFDEYGYIPTGLGCQTVLPGVVWDKFSDTGGYAHLVSAASQWLLYLDQKNDWDQHHVPMILPAN